MQASKVREDAQASSKRALERKLSYSEIGL